MPNRISSRLAARTGIRQVDAVLKADQAARGVDRAIAGLWRELLDILRNPQGYAANYRRARYILQQLRPTVQRAIRERLQQLAQWGHHSAAQLLVQTLPVKYLRAAAPVPVEAVEGYFDEISQTWVAIGFHTGSADQAVSLFEAPEPAEPAPSDDELRRLYQELIFPPPARDLVDRIIFAPTAGRSWQERVAGLSRLASPETLAGILASGISAGKSQREIAKDLLPAVQNVRSSARRIARTEGLRVAHAIQQQAYDQLGDLVIGQQIHAQLDQNTRSWHASRSGTIYYDNPTGDQKGPFQRPNPPEEAADPSERPAGTPQTAYNCRCWLSPVLAPPPEVTEDPARLAVFTTNADKVIPDPAEYSTWFDRANERRRKIAVGAKRYAAIQKQLGNQPITWEHFLDPDTGDLVPLTQLQAESDAERAQRIAQVRSLIAERAVLIRTTSTFGFLPAT